MPAAIKVRIPYACLISLSYEQHLASSSFSISTKFLLLICIFFVLQVLIHVEATQVDHLWDWTPLTKEILTGIWLRLCRLARRLADRKDGQAFTLALVHLLTGS